MTPATAAMMPTRTSLVCIAATASPAAITSGRINVNGPSTITVASNWISAVGENHSAIAASVAVASAPKNQMQIVPASTSSTHVA